MTAAPRSAPQLALDRPIPILALPGFTLFPGTLVPLSAFEPEPCRALAEALGDRRLLVIAALDRPGPDRTLHPIAGLGRIVSDRRHADGRMDAFVHGIARVRIGALDVGPRGLSAAVEALEDWPHQPGVEALRLYAIAASLRRTLEGVHAEEAEALGAVLASSSELGLVTNRLASAMVAPFDERQVLLAERSPPARADLLAAHLGELLIGLTPAGTLH